MNANPARHTWPEVCLADTQAIKPKHMEYYLDKEGRLRVRLMRSYVTQNVFTNGLDQWGQAVDRAGLLRKFSMLTVWGATKADGSPNTPSAVRTHVALARTYIERFGNDHKVEESIHALRTMRLLVEARLARATTVIESSYGKHEFQ
jgi:hypothetical protein